MGTRKASIVAQHFNDFHYFLTITISSSPVKARYLLIDPFPERQGEGRMMHGFFFIGLFFLNHVRSEEERAQLL